MLAQGANALPSMVQTVAEHSSLGPENFRIVKTGGTVGRCAFLDAQLDAALKRVLPAAQIGGLRMSPPEAAARPARHWDDRAESRPGTAPRRPSRRDGPA